MQSPLIGIWGRLTLRPRVIISDLNFISSGNMNMSSLSSGLNVNTNTPPTSSRQLQDLDLANLVSETPKYLILANISDLWFKPPICHLSPHFSKIYSRIVQLFLYQPAGVCSGPLGISYFTIRDLSLNISSPDLSSCLRSRHLVMSSSVLSSRLQTSSSSRVSQYVSETSILANSQIFGLNPHYVT